MAEQPPRIGRVSDRFAVFHQGEMVSPPFNTFSLAQRWLERHAQELGVGRPG